MAGSTGAGAQVAPRTMPRITALGQRQQLLRHAISLPCQKRKRAAGMLVRAEGTNGKGPGDEGEDKASKVGQQGLKLQKDETIKVASAVKERLKRRGVDKATAREIIRAWREQGVEDPESLRKLLVDNSLRSARFVAGQLLFDGVAAGVSLYTAEAVKQTEAFGPVWSLPAQYTFLSVGFYFSIGVLFTMVTLGATMAATMQYNKTAGDVLQAMKELAGPEDERRRRRMSGPGALVDVVGSGRAAVDSLKVVNALNSISTILKDKLEKDGASLQPADLYRDLCAYLLLDRAEKTSGFKAANYGITDAQAAAIALVFNTYDLNGDGELEVREFSKLCEKTFNPLTDDEAAAALRLIDKNQDGRLQFNEFVAWWTSKVELPPQPSTAVEAKGTEAAAT